ncbi:MAG TPA: class I SAM-dependent methyltransferase [Candidatus Dormibacteraeota bacterium]|nr:class I SAM-dependent methyltransferase [Candidatus Dormibacteraeota bacterium]
MVIDAKAYIDRLDEIPGWFFWTDALIIAGFDTHHKARGIHGNLLEIGAYLGKSAVLMGFLQREPERFIVCDLFSAKGTTEEGARENRQWYQDLSRDAFERNYLRFHEVLPAIVEGPSSELNQLGPDSSFRMVHVDGSHTYEVVREDLQTTRRLLGDGGVVIVDDWRQPHTPGVAAATWEAILQTDLLPICFTDQKLYATWDPELAVTAAQVEGWGSPQLRLGVESFNVRDRMLYRVVPWSSSEDGQHAPGHGGSTWRSKVTSLIRGRGSGAAG